MENKQITVDEIRKKTELVQCPAQKSLLCITEFLEGPMCGKCFPCSFGSYEARLRLQLISENRGALNDVSALLRIAQEMRLASMCKKGKDIAQFILEWISMDKFKEHIDSRCAHKECFAMIEYRIDPKKCTNCGICSEECKDNAIIGEKKKAYLSCYPPFQIRQKRCTKCGKCMDVCPEEAISIIDIADLSEAAQAV